MSIRTRVTLFGLGVVALVLVVISVLFLMLVVVGAPGNQDRRLATRSADAVAGVVTASAADLVPRAPLTPADASSTDEVVVLVLAADGTVLSTTGVVTAAPPIPADLRDRARRDGGAFGTVAAGPAPLRVHVRPWERPDLGRTGYVAATQTTGRLRSDRRTTVALIVVSDLVSLVAAAVAIWFAVGRALRPLRQLTTTADEIGRSADLTRRLPPAPRRDHVGLLTASFNAMMDRLEQAYQATAEALAAQRRFTADASHELRTPLTTIRNNVGFLRRHPDATEADRAAALADLDTDSDRMTRLVEDLLTLARADGGQRTRTGPVDLGGLAEQVCRQAAGLHPDRTLHCAGTPVTVTGDPDALRRLLWILLDNAARHTTTGGTIWVTVTAVAGGVTVQVADDGAGIPDGLHERIFDRFFRADASRGPGGSGLGLAIARSVVHAHGGRIGAANNARGGAVFTVTLPVGASSSDS